MLCDSIGGLVRLHDMPFVHGGDIDLRGAIFGHSLSQCEFGLRCPMGSYESGGKFRGNARMVLENVSPISSGQMDVVSMFLTHTKSWLIISVYLMPAMRANLLTHGFPVSLASSEAGNTSQKRSVSSAAAETMVLPSGDMAMCKTRAV